MGMESYQLGREGESTAEKYLVQQGYEIIEKNFHSQQGEVDLIARENGYLVFIEVKSYSFRSLGSPLASVTKSKRQNIIHAAKTYLFKRNLQNQYCRFDVLTIYRRPDGSTAMELYKNAFKIN
jgi:putative endonuclease